MKTYRGRSPDRPSGRVAERVEVTRYDPRRRRLLRGLLALTLALAVLLAFVAGRHFASPEGAGRSVGELEAELRSRIDEVRILEQQVANLQAAAAIGAAATAQLRSTLSETQATVERLSREGELYRSLMDSSVRTKGLTLHRLEIRATGAPGEFVYRATLLQRAQKHVRLTGKFSVEVRGIRKGKAAIVTLPAKPLDLLYFQTVEDEFRLPDGFEARTVRLSAEAGKGRPQKLDVMQDWKIGGG